MINPLHCAIIAFGFMWLRPNVLVTRSRRFLKPQLFPVFVWTGPKSQGCFVPGEVGGGRVLSMMACTGGSARQGYLFQASGI